VKQRTPEQLNRPSLNQYQSEEKMPVCLVLDNVRSGLNVGAIFRTCDAFAVQRIYLCGITASPPHAEIMKTALGATESVAWSYKEKTEEAMDELENMGYQLWPVEQTDHAVLLDDFRLDDSGPVALILGNEMRGVQPDVLKRCKTSLEIPQAGIKHSLNVATTAGIVLWECFRQYRLRRLSSGL
jgi:23S rRNA (guanosine2251-2'-O)-methyltransferase